MEWCKKAWWSLVGAVPMCPPVSPRRGASIVKSSCMIRDAQIYFGMETPLRGRSGGHTGAAPTISRVVCVIKLLENSLPLHKNAFIVVARCSPLHKKEFIVVARCSPLHKNKFIVVARCSPRHKYKCIVVARCSPRHKHKCIVEANSSPRHKH